MPITILHMTTNCNTLALDTFNQFTQQKMIHKYLIFLVSIMVLCTQCKTKALTSLDDHSGRHISFGNGGGFTGKILNYILLDNGQMYRGQGISEGVKPFKTISDEQTEQIFNTYDDMGFSNLDIDSPGNMYFYVEMHESDEQHKLLWGSHDAGESKELRVFHANLMALVKPQMNKTPSNQMEK